MSTNWVIDDKVAPIESITGQFPDRKIPRLDNSPTDNSPTDNSPTGQLPDRTIPRLNYSKTKIKDYIKVSQ